MLPAAVLYLYLPATVCIGLYLTAVQQWGWRAADGSGASAREGLLGESENRFAIEIRRTCTLALNIFEYVFIVRTCCGGGGKHAIQKVVQLIVVSPVSFAPRLLSLCVRHGW